MKPFVSKSTYGFLNYILALLMIASPWLFGFQHQRGASLFMPLYLGWLHLIMAIFSRNKWGFIKVFPVSMHCFIDVVVGSFFLASPFVYGYTDQIWVPQFLMGSVMFLLGIFTEHSPLTDEPHHVFKDGLLNNTGDLDEEMTH